MNPRTYWKEHQHEFPVLALLARDLFSIPATGAGVERLFNSARDICHYRRGSLNESTIQDLMMLMCATKFEVEEHQLAHIQHYQSDEERQEQKEKESAQAGQDIFDPISDDEDDDMRSTAMDIQYTHLSTRENTPIIQLEDKSNESESNDESAEEQDAELASDVHEAWDNDEPPLPPTTQHGMNRKRTSERVRMPSKRLRGYVVDL